jgi:anti-sigma28 factor (negative regulator of flagellin synthesis)
MSAINGIGGNTPIQRVVSQPIQKQLPVEPAKQQKAIADKVQLSHASHVSHVQAAQKADGTFRADKVNAIRTQIQAGTYETEAKLEAAIDRLLDELGR